MKRKFFCGIPGDIFFDTWSDRNKQFFSWPKVVANGCNTTLNLGNRLLISWVIALRISISHQPISEIVVHGG